MNLKQRFLEQLRQENEEKFRALRETVEKTFKGKAAISNGLKVVHKKTGILYTVKSPGVEDIVLTTPEGEDFLIDKDEFEANYALE